MKRILYICFLIIFSGLSVFANEPDSVYVFSYTTDQHNHSAGLHYAWSIDQENWQTIGPEWRFLFSDFGRWGTQKKMINPFLFQDENGLWHCLWTLNKEVGQFAHAATNDLINWKRQSYPELMEHGNIIDLEVSLDKSIHQYIITWLSEVNNETNVYKTTTSDFKSYSVTQKTTESERLCLRSTIVLEDEKQTGTINKVPWEIINGMISWHQWSLFHNQQRAEKMVDDPVRFSNLGTVEASISVVPEKSKKITNMLVGIFFEDINYAADGGLYAELVQNRGFEYALSDREGKDSTWNSYKAWSIKGELALFTIDTVSPIHSNNKHFAVLDIEKIGSGITNEGFDGITVRAGEKYDFSVFAKSIEGNSGRLLIRLTDENGNVFAETKTKVISGSWKRYEIVLEPKESSEAAKIEIIPQVTGKVALDMISLFPQNTFNKRKNGLRADLAQTIADVHPKFIRFPGGCVAHGDGLGNMYRWSNTVGPLESRKVQRNIWGYHQSAGLGYFEYFQYCEDIGAEPIPVLPAGVPCQNSATCGHGQQGGIPLCEMDKYIQEVLDLIEWANGDKTSKWGKLRAEAGHPEPFKLKYIGIGNEDLITDIFEERFTMIFEALKEKHPEIVVIGTVGPTYMGTDYEEGWELATKLGVPMVDEHYYQPPGWFIHNQDFYDKYDRSKSKVYLGEYAAHLPGRPRNIETALAEALYLTSIERNGDVVDMTSYAPLLAKEGHTQWNPNLIYFNNNEVKLTVGYYVQKLFGQNSGETYIPTKIRLSIGNEEVRKRVALSIVRDKETSDVIIKLVNLLPSQVNAAINLSGLNVEPTEAINIVLKGKPADISAKIEENRLLVSENFKYQLPAYSLSVIRIKTNK